MITRGYGTPQAVHISKVGHLCMECLAKRLNQRKLEVPNRANLYKWYADWDGDAWVLTVDSVRDVFHHEPALIPVRRVYCEGMGIGHQTVLDRQRCIDCNKRLRHACTDY